MFVMCCREFNSLSLDALPIYGITGVTIIRPVVRHPFLLFFLPLLADLVLACMVIFILKLIVNMRGE